MPLGLRHKTDWYWAAMDAMIENDTHNTHWKLLLDDSKKLLEFLFPDNVLFWREKERLAKNFGHHSMDNILKFYISEGLYKLSDKKKKQYWTTAPPLEPEASTKCECPLAIFFNQVLECTKKACLMVEFK